MISLLHRTLVLAALAVPASAQRTFIVDRLGGAGSHFTDLPAAEAAAQDGDTLVLRSGSGVYTAIQTGKALSIVCDIGQAVIRGSALQPFQIVGVPAGKTFALKSCALGFDATYGLAPGLQIAYCQGRVHLDTIEIFSGQPSLDVLFSAVTIKESRIPGIGGIGLSAFGCFLDVSGTNISGTTGDSRFSQPPAEAVFLDACDASFAGCGLGGGSGDQGFAPAPAITVRNSRLDLGTGGSLASVYAGSNRVGGTGPASAVVGQSSVVRVDPAVNVVATNGAPLFAGVVPVMAPVPSLSGAGIRTLSLRYRGVPGAPTLTVFGLSGGPVINPAFAGELWVDPRYLFVQPGVVSMLPFQIPVGLTVVAQVLSVAPAGIEFSNAVAITGR